LRQRIISPVKIGPSAGTGTATRVLPGFNKFGA
jgi:hypothetical protein